MKKHKKVILIAVAIGIILFCSAYDQTAKYKYHTLRDTVSAADTDLTAAQKTWSHYLTNYTSSGASYKLPRGANFAHVVFDHKNANTDTATFILYGYRENGPAEFICSGNLTAGAQETGDSTTRYYADTIESLTQRWIGNIDTCDASGNNGVAKVNFDTYGIARVVCLFSAISTSDDVRAKIVYE